MTTTKTMCTYANKFDQLIMQVKINLIAKMMKESETTF